MPKSTSSSLLLLAMLIYCSLPGWKVINSHSAWTSASATTFTRTRPFSRDVSVAACCLPASGQYLFCTCIARAGPAGASVGCCMRLRRSTPPQRPTSADPRPPRRCCLVRLRTLSLALSSAEKLKELAMQYTGAKEMYHHSALVELALYGVRR